MSFIRRRNLGFCVVLFAALLSGCGQSGDDSRFGTYTVMQMSDAERNVSLVVRGRVSNRAPVPHELGIEWQPIDWVELEGADVKQGDVLMTLDTTFIERNARHARDNIAVAEQEFRKTQLDTVQKLMALELQKKDLIGTKAVLLKEIEATRKKDLQAIEIARLELQLVRVNEEETRQKFERIQELHTSGYASRKNFLDAQSAYEKAKTAIRVPALRLEILETGSARTRRRLYEIALHRLQLDLGTAEHTDGIFGTIAALERTLEWREKVKTGGIRWNQGALDRQEKNIEAPHIISVGTGVLQYAKYQNDRVQPGGRLGPGAILFVLEDHELVVNFFLPEKWRPLIRPWRKDNPDGGAVTISVPALSNREFQGRILSVASLPEEVEDGSGRGYNCTARIDDLDPLLKVGMGTQCRLQVTLPPSAASVPLWLVSSVRNPTVEMEDGSTRKIEGWPLGGRFIVRAGLDVGDRIDARTKGKNKGTHRLSGSVQPVEFLPVYVEDGKPQEMDILEIIPDGAWVKKGDVIAKLQARWRADMWQTMESAARTVQTAATYEIAKIKAESDLAKAFVAWQKAVLAAEEAHLDHYLTRYVSFDIAQTTAEAALKHKAIDLQRQRQELESITKAGTAAMMSVNKFKALALNLAVAESGYARAELSVVLALRKRDWLEVWDTHETLRSAESEALTQAELYTAARGAYRLALNRAMGEMKISLEHIKGLKRVMKNRTVIAPRDGRLFYHTTAGRPLPRIGRSVPSDILFYTPVGTRRKVELEVPVRFYSRIQMGGRMDLVVPSIGLKPVPAVVMFIAANFGDSAQSRNAHFLRGSVGVSEKVFKIVLEFDVDAEDSDGLAPGVTAYIDL